MSDPKKTPANPNGSHYVAALWGELLKSFGKGTATVKRPSDATMKRIKSG